MSHTAELLLSYINLILFFMAVASDTQVFTVALELLLKWLLLTKGGGLIERTSMQIRVKAVCSRILTSKDQLFNNLTL